MEVGIMCNEPDSQNTAGLSAATIPVTEAVGTVLAHDITEIRPGEFKGRAFKKGHVVRHEDIPHLQRLGKNRLFILRVNDDEMHENDAARSMAEALMGEGVRMAGEPNEGKINLVADRDGLLRIDRDALLQFNMLGEVMCATMHSNTLVKKDQLIAGTRAIPLVVKKQIVEEAVRIGQDAGGVLSVKSLRRPRAGIVITGNEVYSGRIRDAFAPVIRNKIQSLGGEIIDVHFAPDNAAFISEKISSLLENGADLIITTGGMSVDPDDVTRFAIRNLGVEEFLYGSPVLPGSMLLIAYVRVKSPEYGDINEHQAKLNTPDSKLIPIIGIPACGMYAKITVFDLVLPRILAGEMISRRDIAELGHGGLCLKCRECRYPVCPFGK